MMQLRNPFVYSRGRSAVRRSVCVSLAALMISGGIVALSGCGAHSDDNDPYAYVSTGATAYTSRDYTTNVTLADGTTGTLVARVLADGTAQGTFTPDAVEDRSRVVITTPFLNGTFNTTTGEINIGGSYTVNGHTINLSINGVLPVPPATSGGHLNYSINGENFSGSWSVTIPNPTTNPSPVTSPNPTVSPSPGGGTGGVGGTQSITLANVNSNATLTPFSNPVIAGAHQSSAAGNAISVVISEPVSGTNMARALTMVALDNTGSGVTTGNIDVLDILNYTGTGNLSRNISMSYVETQLNGSVARYFVAKSGSVQVVSVSATSITLHLTNVRFEPLTTYSASSTGAFTVSGDVTSTIQ